MKRQLFHPRAIAALAAVLLSNVACFAAAPAPFGAVPNERQVAWQRLEYYGFVHFGLNTWTDREWGYGNEDPKLFNPSAFDARAIVRHFKDAGMTGMILTAKHHDGFCLWPTKTTEHNISQSPWKNGKGDVVREFADACRAEGMKLGIYVSPWDRSQPEYAREGYVKAFHQQIREVLSNYGPIFEIWFDGANGGDGYYGGAKETRKISENYYRFDEIVAMVRQLQPECVVWGAGSIGDARWGGSEQGHVGYPHWHTLAERGGDAATGVRLGTRWVPAEGDVSIRPGWFWHEREDRMVKSPEKLLQVWFDCVGRGANLILNVPPDRDGRIREPDVQTLLGFRKLRDELFATNLAAGATATGPARAGGLQFAAANLTDGDLETYWAPDDGFAQPAAEIKLERPANFDVLRLREQIRLGQRVEAFAVDAWLDGKFTEIHAGQTIGNQVLVKLRQPILTDRLRVRITKSLAAPCLSEFSLFRMPVVFSAPEISRGADAKVVVSGKGGGLIRYTVDGTDPAGKSSLYSAPFALPLGGTVKARVFDVASEQSGPVATRVLGVVKADWKLVSATAGEAWRAFDDNPTTFWHTHLMSGERRPPQCFVVDMGREVRVSAFTYLPRQDGTAHGMTDRYRFDLSRDGENWAPAAEGEFSNIRANPVEHTVPLTTPTVARYFRFTGLHALEKNHVSAAEIGIIAAPEVLRSSL